MDKKEVARVHHLHEEVIKENSEHIDSIAGLRISKQVTERILFKDNGSSKPKAGNRLCLLGSTQQNQHADSGASNQLIMDSVGNGGNGEKNTVQQNVEVMETGIMEPIQPAQGMEEAGSCNIL